MSKKHVILITQDIDTLVPHHMYFHTVKSMYGYKLKGKNNYYWITSNELKTDMKNLTFVEYDIVDYYHHADATHFTKLHDIENSRFYD